MEKIFDTWKKSIKRSFGRKIGGDIALELQKLDEAERTQLQQDQKVQDTEHLPVPAKKTGPWKSLKRSLGRTLGLKVRHELEKEEEEQPDGQSAEGLQAGPSPVAVLNMHEAVDAGLTYKEGAALTRMAAAEDLLAATPTTIPARYRVRRMRFASDEARIRLPVRSNGPAQVDSGAGQSTAHASRVSLHDLDALDLGTTPTTPSYPHPLEVVAPVPTGRGKFATWSARSKPFWCCNQHSSGTSLGSSPPGPSRPRPRSPAPAAYERYYDASEDIEPTAPHEAQSDDRFTCPSSADPALLKPALLKAVEGLSAELRDEEGEIEIGYAGSAEDLQPAQSPAESVEEAGAVGMAFQNEAEAGIREYEGAEVFLPLQSGSEETLHGDVQHQVVAGSPADIDWDASAEDLPAELLDEEVNMQRIQASIASLQQAVPSNVEEGELEAIVEEEEGDSLEDPDAEAALMRQALLHVVLGERRAVELREQRAVSSTLLASAELSEDLQGQNRLSGTKGLEPAEWLSSKYECFPGESPAESSTASTPAYRLRDREEPGARAEKVRNWFDAREKKKKAAETANDLRDASSLDERNRALNTSSPRPCLGLSEPANADSVESSAVVASPDEHVGIPDAGRSVSVLRAPRLRIRTRQQIARDSSANHRNSVVTDGWAYPARQQDADQRSPNAGADVGLATIDECVEDLQAEPTEQDTTGGHDGR